MSASKRRRVAEGLFRGANRVSRELGGPRVRRQQLTKASLGRLAARGTHRFEREAQVRRKTLKGLTLLKRFSDRGDIPIANWFKENPMGNLVALFLLFMIVYLWMGNLPTNPYVNDANFVSQWGLFYNTTKWMLTIAIPGFILAVSLSAIHEGAQRAEGIVKETSLSKIAAGIKLRTARLSQPKIEEPKPMGISPVTGGFRTDVSPSFESKGRAFSAKLRGENK